MTMDGVTHDVGFLSTPSARRATAGAFLVVVDAERISIHALREEGDCNPGSPQHWFYLFLSTPSARRATSASPLLQKDKKDFYPRPPRGGRRERTDKEGD